MRLGLRLATGLVLALGVTTLAVFWVGSGMVMKPEWYQHRTPEQGLLPRDGDPWGEVGWQGIHHDPGVDFGYAFEEVEFPAEDGATLRGWYVPGRPGARVGVVTVHGAGADRRDFLRHLPIFHEDGYPVLLFDCREHGISDGAARGISLGIREHRDVTSAVRYAKEVRSLEQVAVIGTSQGGASVILAASVDPRIDAVIAENPFQSATALIADSQLPVDPPPRWVLETLASVTVWRLGGWNLSTPLEAVSRIAPRPLLIMHGTEDRIIPFAHSESLRANAGDGAELWLLDGATHAALFNRDRVAYRNRVAQFLARSLGPAVPSR